MYIKAKRVIYYGSSAPFFDLYFQEFQVLAGSQSYPIITGYKVTLQKCHFLDPLRFYDSAFLSMFYETPTEK